MNGEKNPKYIFELYQKGELDRITAINTYLSLIESGSGVIFRSQCLDYLGFIHPLGNESFKKIENFLLSDTSPLVRISAATIIIQDFLDEGLSSLK